MGSNGNVRLGMFIGKTIRGHCRKSLRQDSLSGGKSISINKPTMLGMTHVLRTLGHICADLNTWYLKASLATRWLTVKSCISI